MRDWSTAKLPKALRRSVTLLVGGGRRHHHSTRRRGCRAEGRRGGPRAILRRPLLSGCAADAGRRPRHARRLADPDVGGERGYGHLKGHLPIELNAHRKGRAAKGVGGGEMKGSRPWNFLNSLNCLTGLKGASSIKHGWHLRFTAYM